MTLHLGGHLNWYDKERRAWFQVSIERPTPLVEILRALELPVGEVALCAVNGALVELAQATVRDDDRVELFPPIGGG